MLHQIVARSAVRLGKPVPPEVVLGAAPMLVLTPTASGFEHLFEVMVGSDLPFVCTWVC